MLKITLPLKSLVNKDKLGGSIIILFLSIGNELTYQCNKFLMYCNGKVLDASLCYTKSPNNWKEYWKGML